MLIRGVMRYLIAVILVILVVVFGTVALLRSFNGGSKTSKALKITKMADFDNNTNAVVSWTMQGRLVGENQRRSLRITITESERTAEILDGYEQTPDKTQTEGNTQAAFATFLRALDNLNFGRPRNFKTSDERGFCPTGNRFVYQLDDGSNQVFRTWADSCQSGDGTFGGVAATTGTVFKAQITDYGKFIFNTSLQ